METTQERRVSTHFGLNGYEGCIVSWSGFTWVCMSVDEDHFLYGKDMQHLPPEMWDYVNYVGSELPGANGPEPEHQDDKTWWVCFKEPSLFIMGFAGSPYIQRLARTLTYLLDKYNANR